MFSPELVSVVTNSFEADEKSPVITFNYTIKNRNEDADNKIPEIWVYSTNNIPKSYILAIDVSFDAEFKIPNSSVTYIYSEVGDPGNEISGIEDIKDGYRRMTVACFAKFSDKMSVNLGLEKVYAENDSVVAE